MPTLESMHDYRSHIHLIRLNFVIDRDLIPFLESIVLPDGVISLLDSVFYLGEGP